MIGTSFLSGGRARACLFGAAAGILFAIPQARAQRPTTAGVHIKAQTYAPDVVERGHQRFEQNCAFCHGREATGGESGPDLTHSGVVAADVHGDKIGNVVRNGLPGGMPKFDFSQEQIVELAAFIHTEAAKANSDEAQRRKIGLSDLLTGNVADGKQYFDSKCAGCHSPTGDLAGIARKYKNPIQLETRMLYPWGAQAKVTVTLPSGQTVAGQLIHANEFTVALRDSDGWYRSWPASEVKYSIDDPAEAHVKLLPQYSDADVHNLFAYLNTLR
ncbi:MAG TPA: c-type cytochrome [Bryobacteraceae bacterium]|nr:c-type cytochrome [Bryobacteraceae bacterium]